MEKFSWYSAYKLLAVVSLGAVVEVVVIAVSEMNNILLIVISGILSLFASLAFVQGSVFLFGKIKTTLKNIATRKRRAKVFINCVVVQGELVIFLHNNEFILSAKDVTCDITSLYAGHKFQSYAIWRNSKNKSTTIGRKKKDFVYLATPNPDGTFSVKHEKGVEIFDNGWYEFSCHIKGNMAFLRETKKVVLDEYFDINIEFIENKMVAEVKIT